ncbi:MULTISPECIES: alpha/beta hydrolase [Anaeromyxobacter]|uniref:alpha/beta hydrolase n=1 Tax=Anaeromyxobacter TaxID=161492 RepID=UPI001F57710E|nr:MULTISPECIES: alpha/beta hydrolase [unclassified Anaeromyxobacter]
MVMTGQFLERPALVDVQGLVLEALYHRGSRRPALLVCPPLGGGGMDAPPVAELAWSAARAGHPSLRFQHRGVGASQGAPDPARALDDALAALRHLAETAGGSIALAGVGSGCETALALAAARPELARLVLVAPERAPRPAAGARVLVLVPEHGARVQTGECEGAQVDTVPDADALFRAGLPEMGRRAVEWIGRG